MAMTATTQQSTDTFCDLKLRGQSWIAWWRRWAQAGAQWGLTATRQQSAMSATATNNNHLVLNELIAAAAGAAPNAINC
jgi:hypothetical protein